MLQEVACEQCAGYTVRLAERLSDASKYAAMQVGGRLCVCAAEVRSGEEHY